MSPSTLKSKFASPLDAAHLEIGRVLLDANNLDDLLQQCCDVLRTCIDAAFVRIWVVNANESLLELRANSGFPIDFNGPLRKIPIGRWRIGKVAASQIADFGSPSLEADHDAFACIPISCHGKVLGVMSVGRCPSASHRNASKLMQIAGLIALAIERIHQSLISSESNQRLQAVLKVHSIGTWFWDSEFKRLRSDENANRLLNIRHIPDPDWHVILQHIHDDDRSHVQQRIESATQQPQAFRIRFRSGSDALQSRWLELTGSSHFVPSGILIALPCVLIDITEQRNNEVLLQKAMLEVESSNKARGEFIANISHEIRTPLTMILGSAEILAEKSLPVDQSQWIDSVKSNGEFLLKILDDILDLSKIDASLIRIQDEPASIRNLASELQSGLLPRCKAKGIDLAIRVSTDVPAILRIDSLRLRQILINLIGNGIKFTEAGSVTLEIRYEQADSLLVLLVRDTGIGIPSEWLDRIFEPFSQVDSNHSRTYGGAGLGLAICQKLVRAMRGTLTVSSIVGKGSTFSIKIPSLSLGVDDSGMFHHLEPVREVTLLTPKKLTGRVLVVDDRRDIQMIVEHFLTDAGIEVAIANSGPDAIQILENSQNHDRVFNAVLLDLHMPGMDGMETLSALREHDFSMPVIALTASSRADCELLVKENGFAANISKPIDPKALLAVVTTFLTPQAR